MGRSRAEQRIPFVGQNFLDAKGNLLPFISFPQRSRECDDHDEVHAHQIQASKTLLLENVEQLFGASQPRDGAGEATVQRRHTKVRELTMERDFLSKALARNW
jgi:hypothetical protein